MTPMMDADFYARHERSLLARLQQLRRFKEMGTPQIILDRQRVLIRRALRNLEYDMPLEEPEEAKRLGLLPITEEQYQRFLEENPEINELDDEGTD